MHYSNKKHFEHHTEIVALQMFVFVTDQKRCPRHMGFNQKQMESEISINSGLVKMLDD